MLSQYNVSMRMAYVHVGTHKTGTTSIQAMLAANEIALAQEGVYIPRTGRPTDSFAAHHNIAYELAQNPQFDPTGGTLAELLDEIRVADAPAICLSSEEFESLSCNRGGLQRLFTGLLGLGYEIYGFACRIIISGRPPVTDLYETVIWVSFIGMVFAIILEAVYRKRYFFYAGLPAAILTLIVADSDSTILDASINPLTAVLRNNMWLTIHVLTIVSSYAAFALTAALGHIALVMSLWGKRYAAAQSEVQFFIYRAMQIGILLLAAGTILGGVWANYSWGRFWGWDPKETWALITLLCYLALLHGRLAGWWKGFGLAVGSVVCFLSVMMSWYGVNFILGQNGKSLHSYGLSTGGLSYATGFALFEILFVGFVITWNRKHAPVKVASSPASPEPGKDMAGQGA